MNGFRTAKLFRHGRSQAVRLPKDFRLPVAEVKISRDGDKVILEPLAPKAFDVVAWRAQLRALGSEDFLPEGAPPDPEMPADDISFD
jgi:antitoxin VapB